MARCVLLRLPVRQYLLAGVAELVLLLVQTCDDAAATDLYLRYAPRLRALARQYCGPDFAGRFDADDVVQSVFRTFFHGVRRQAYDVPPDGELWGLLMVLALNEVRNLVEYHRAGKRAVQHTATAHRPDYHPALGFDGTITLHGAGGGTVTVNYGGMPGTLAGQWAETYAKYSDNGTDFVNGTENHRSQVFSGVYFSTTARPTSPWMRLR